MYPEKAILDIAGFPSVKGRNLIEGLMAQAAPFDPVYLLGMQARELSHDDDGRVRIITSAGQVVVAARLSSPAASEPSPRVRWRRVWSSWIGG
ncbi:hypothetical protein GCM10020255_044810 [Rhodococcus baikonurensis]